MVWGAGLICFVILSVSAQADSYSQYRWQRVVKLHSAKSKSKMIEKVERGGGVVLGGGESFIVIRPKVSTPRERYEALVRSLVADADVEAVTADVPSFPRDSWLAPHASREKSPEPPAPPPKLQGERAESGAGCQLYPHCGRNNPFWARLQVGADLADDLVSRAVAAAPDKGVARVAVVDSGFDTKNQASSIDAKKLTVLKGHDSAGNQDIDPDGHGTAVAGVISGKGVGITRHVELSVYRVTEPHGGGGVSTALLAAAIEKACETADVVNVSWGSLLDEIGLKDVTKELWYKKAAEKGCLVVKSAGNGGYKKKKGDGERVPLEAPFISAAASDEFSEDAPFSSEGALFAPGAGIYSLLSSQHEYGPTTTKYSCSVGGAQVGPINGTSFASPLIAGVAGQVITLLRARGVLPKVPGDKMKLVKSILLASAQWSKRSGSRQPVVNATVAALIAQSVSPDGPRDVPSLIASAQKSAPIREGCAKPANDCARETKCELKKKCVDNLRFQFLVCVPPPEGIKPSPELDRRLFESLKQFDERELTLQLIDRLPPKGPLTKEVVAELDRHWKALLDKDRVDINNTTTAMNLLHAARRSDIAEQLDLPSRLRELLKSYELHAFFNFSYPLGTETSQLAQELQAGKFFDIFKSMPVDEQVRLVRELPAKWGSVAPQLDLLYFMNANKDSLPEATRAALEARLKEVAELWFEKKLGNGGNYDHLVNKPTTELLLSLVTDGQKRIQKVFEAPVTTKALHLYTLGLLSKDVLGARRLELVERLVKDPGMAKSDYAFVLGHALEVLATEGSPDAIRGTLRKTLLENPHVRLPSGARESFESSLTDRQKMLGGDDFFPKFIQVNLERGIQKLKGKEIEWYSHNNEIKNVMVSIDRNALMPVDAKKKLLAGPAGKLLEQFVEAAGTNLLGQKDVKNLDLSAVLSASSTTVDEIIGAQEMFKEAGFEEGLKRGFKALHEDILKTPGKYPQSLRISMARLYGLAE